MEWNAKRRALGALLLAATKAELNEFLCELQRDNPEPLAALVLHLREEFAKTGQVQEKHWRLFRRLLEHLLDGIIVSAERVWCTTADLSTLADAPVLNHEMMNFAWMKIHSTRHPHPRHETGLRRCSSAVDLALTAEKRFAVLRLICARQNVIEGLEALAKSV